MHAYKEYIFKNLGKERLQYEEDISSDILPKIIVFSQSLKVLINFLGTNGSENQKSIIY